MLRSPLQPILQQPIQSALHARSKGVRDISTDVIIVAFGQSNEQATNVNNNAPIDAVLDQDSSGRIRRWVAGSNTDVLAVQPLVGWPSGSQLAPLRSFRMAQELLARQNPSKKIVIVNTAVGGAGLVGGTLGVGGTYYNETISRLTACLSAFPGSLVILSWTQGETDADPSISAETYASAFTAMVAGLRTVPGAENMIAVVHQMQPGRFIGSTADFPRRAVIDQVHKQIPLSVARSIFVGASLGTGISNDLTHFAPQGHRNAGIRAAATFKNAERFLTAIPSTPAAPTPRGRTIEIAVQNPQPPAYVVEYRTYGSTGAWTQVVAFPDVWVDTFSTFELSVPGIDREVRLSARSYAGTSAPSAAVRVTYQWDVSGGSTTATVNAAPSDLSKPIASAGPATGQITVAA